MCARTYGDFVEQVLAPVGIFERLLSPNTFVDIIITRLKPHNDKRIYYTRG
jgi:hypothetical protein